MSRRNRIRELRVVRVDALPDLKIPARYMITVVRQEGSRNYAPSALRMQLVDSTCSGFSMRAVFGIPSRYILANVSDGSYVLMAKRNLDMTLK